MSTKSVSNGKREFVTLEVRQFGFAVYGYGSGVNQCVFRGRPLLDYLNNEVCGKLLEVKKRLNEGWENLNKEHPEDPKNRAVIQDFLFTASWAYALTVDLVPFQIRCMHGPTNPLRFFILYRLEEIFTKCFAAAHIFGTESEQIVGLRGLVTDFTLDGGVDIKTGEPGEGLGSSMFQYYRAYFAPTNMQPIVYQSFEVLVDRISELVLECYPKCSKALAGSIVSLLLDPLRGFGNKEIVSPAKTGMMEKLSKIAVRLDGEVEHRMVKAA